MVKAYGIFQEYYAKDLVISLKVRGKGLENLVSVQDFELLN